METINRSLSLSWNCYLKQLVLVLCISLALQSCSEGERGGSTSGKNIAPDFTLNLLSGSGSFQLSSSRGNPVVINFFASWCNTCGIEAGDLERVYQEFAARNVIFVGVGIDDTLVKARQFLEKNGITYPAGLDETGSIKENYGLHGLPYTFFVDREGNISYVHAGAVTGLLLKYELEKLL